MKTTRVSRYEYNIFNDESETAIFFSLCDVIIAYKNGAISGQPVPIIFYFEYNLNKPDATSISVTSWDHLFNALMDFRILFKRWAAQSEVCIS